MLYSMFFCSKFLIDKNLLFNNDNNNINDFNNNTTESPEIPPIIPEVPEKEINPTEEIPEKITPDEVIDPKITPEIEYPNENEVVKIIDNIKKTFH